MPVEIAANQLQLVAHCARGAVLLKIKFRRRMLRSIEPESHDVDVAFQPRPASCCEGIGLCEHIEGDGDLIYRHACKMGLEGMACRNAAAACTRPGSRVIDSRAKTPRARRWCVRRQRIGTYDQA